MRLGSGYALSLSTAQLVGVLMIALLTWMNTRGLKLGKLVQNVFTIAKTGALIALIVLGVIVGWNADAVAANFGDLWTVRGTLQDVGGGLTAAAAFGLFVGICVAQTNSLFSADAWHNITFTAGEVKDPKRNIPLSLAFGTILVIGLVSAREYRLSGDTSVDCNSTGSERSSRVGNSRCHLSGIGCGDDGGRHHDLDVRVQQRTDPDWCTRLLRDGKGRSILSRGWRSQQFSRSCVGTGDSGNLGGSARIAAHGEVS